MNHHVIKTIGSQSVSHSVIHSIKISLINYSRERERERQTVMFVYISHLIVIKLNKYLMFHLENYLFFFLNFLRKSCKILFIQLIL